MKIFIILIIAFILYSCGSDTVTNPSNSTHSTDTISLYTKDSLYLDNNSSSLSDSVLWSCPAQVDTLHISFELFSIRSDGFAAIVVNANEVFHKDIMTTNGTSFDSSYALTVTVNHINFTNEFLIHNFSYQSNHLFSLRHLSVWYIKRT